MQNVARCLRGFKCGSTAETKGIETEEGQVSSSCLQYDGGTYSKSKENKLVGRNF